MIKIIYDPGSGDVTLVSKRGPNQFRCWYQSRVHDNLATSGLRERILEGSDILIAFMMPSHIVDDDLPDWAAFMTFALGGGQFDFYPNSAGADYYTCVLEDDSWDPVRVAPGRYQASYRFRVVANAPGDPASALQKFCGV